MPFYLEKAGMCEECLLVCGELDNATSRHWRGVTRLAATPSACAFLALPLLLDPAVTRAARFGLAVKRRRNVAPSNELRHAE